MKLAPDQVVVEWQELHVVGNPAAAWFGLVVCWYADWWQLTQAVESPVKTPP